MSYADQATLCDGQVVDPLGPDRPGCGITLCDAWPDGRLQAQLDRIEARLRGDGDLVTISQLIAFRPEPGDVLIYQTPHAISLQQAETVRRMHADSFPGTRCIVLADGMTVAQSNRWLAFSDLELRDLFEVTARGPIRLGQEIAAELDRRAS